MKKGCLFLLFFLQLLFACALSETVPVITSAEQISDVEGTVRICWNWGGEFSSFRILENGEEKEAFSFESADGELSAEVMDAPDGNNRYQVVMLLPDGTESESKAKRLSVSTAWRKARLRISDGGQTGEGTVRLGWSGLRGVDGYEIGLAEGKEITPVLTVTGDGTLSAELQNTGEGLNRCCVRAFYHGEYGEWSSSFAVKVQEYWSAAPKLTVSQPNSDHSIVRLDWTSDGEPDGFAVLNGTEILQEAAGTERGLTLTLSVPGSYLFRVQPYRTDPTAGERTYGKASAGISLKVSFDRPEPPESVSAQQETGAEGCVSLNWETQNAADSYRVYEVISGEEVFLEETSEDGTLLTGAADGSHVYAVSSVRKNAAGGGVEGKTKQAEPVEVEPVWKTAGPSLLILRQTEPGKVLICWSSVPGVTSYRVEFGTGESRNSGVVEGTAAEVTVKNAGETLFRVVPVVNGEDGIASRESVLKVTAEPCTHENKEITLLETPESYESCEDAGNHLIRYRDTELWECPDCGAFGRDTSGTSTGWGEHIFDPDESDGCLLCGAVSACSHRNTSPAKYRMNEKREDQTGDDVYHEVSFDLYSAEICEDCGSVLLTAPLEKNEKALEPHSYGQNSDICAECGHVNGCLHEGAETETRGTDWKRTPIEGDFRVHTVSCRETVWQVCPYCGAEKLLRETGDTKEEREAHDWDENGVCRLCGYQNDCTHEELCRAYETGSRLVKYEEAEGNDRSHYRVCMGTVSAYCPDCGWRMPPEDSGKTIRIQEKHGYDENGVCTDCGHVNACTHPSSAERTEEQTADVYEIADDNVLHSLSGIRRSVEYCTECGQVLSEKIRSRFADLGTAEHAYDADGVCRLCGHVNTCEHENAVLSETLTDFHYEPSEDGKEHIAVWKTEVRYDCPDCGEEGLLEEPQTFSGECRPHVPGADGVCILCGAAD